MNMLVTKIEALKEKAGTDLSTAEDLSIAVMNLVISLEEHFFFTGVKTENDKYFDTAWIFARSGRGCWANLCPITKGKPGASPSTCWLPPCG